MAHERPSKISGSASSTEETLLYVLADYLLYSNNSCDHILLLQPTSPIRFKGTVNRFLDFYLDGGYDSALTTTKFHNFFWRNTVPVSSSYDPANRPMRQVFTQQDYSHLENGNAYLTNRRIFEKEKCRSGGNVGLFPISELEGMQIDTHEELEIFRAVFSGKIPKKMGLE